MAKPSNLADASQALPDPNEARVPMDSALDDLIGYAMRRAQLKLRSKKALPGSFSIVRKSATP